MLVATLLLLMKSIVEAAQWPSGTTTGYILNSGAFIYSNFASLSISAIHTTNDNVNLFTVGKGKISGVDNIIVYKMDHNFNIQWNSWIAGIITHEGSDLSTDESALFILPSSTSQCVLWKINSIDGSMNILKLIQSVKNWQSAKVISNYVIISGRLSSNSIVIMLNDSDLSLVNSYTHTSDDVSFAYPYLNSLNKNLKYCIILKEYI